MLDKISIKNFKSLYDVSLHLSGLNILAGANGAGKSSIIQAITLLKQFADSGVRELPLRGEFVSLGTAKDIFSEFSGEDVVRMGYSIRDGESDELVFKKKDGQDDFLLLSMDLFPDGEHHMRSVISKKFNDIPLSKINIEKEAFLNAYFLLNKIQPLRQVLRDFQYLSTSRIEPKTLYTASSKFINGGSIGIHGEYAAHYLSRAQNEELKNKKFTLFDKESMTLGEALNAWMSFVAPNIQVIPRWNPDLNAATLSYSFIREQDKTAEYKPVNVGFGITYVLPVVLAILKAKPGSILVIENPEAHLHPAAQVVVGKMCAIAAESGVQVVVETHSDHFVNGVRVAVKEGIVSKDNVAFFFVTQDSWGKAQIKHPKVLENGRLDSWPEGFFDEWDNQLEKLL